MITEKDIKVGAVFVSSHPTYKDKEIRILSYFDGDCTLTLGDGTPMFRSAENVARSLNALGYKIKEKPLDQAFKTLDKIYCQHKNIVKDTWFNSRVYKHCKDCGAAID